MNSPACLVPSTALTLPRGLAATLARGWRITALGVALVAALLAGCGSPGAPQPPSLKMPAPASDLAVTRVGDAVKLRWTMPRRSTDRVPLAGDQRVVICRGSTPTPCNPVGELLLLAGQPAAYTDALPGPLRSGPPGLLVYTVLLENHKGRAAGPSNPAYTAAGAAPPAPANLHAEARSNGIVLRWQDLAPTQAGGAALKVVYLLRLDRSRVADPAQSSATRQAGAPAEQTLEVPQATTGADALDQGWTQSYATDQNAALNHTYRYTVSRIARLSLQGHPVEVSSVASLPALVNARDVFPPTVPQGLQAVADSEGGAIDLSWTADSDPDLAGYAVYRRESGSAAPPIRVSGAALLTDAAWRDASAQRSVRYAYSATATDTSGNESARSAEVEEMLEPAGPPIPPASKSSPGKPSSHH